MNERYKPHTYEGETPAERPSQYRDNVSEITETLPAEKAVRITINSLNESVLNEIFAEYYGKSGFDVRTLDPIPFDHIKIVSNPDETWLGKFDSSTQQIELNAIKFYTPLGDVNEADLVNTVIHEQLHAISSIHQPEQHHTGFSEMTRKMGIQRQQKLSSDAGTLHFGKNNFLNEGITQIIADEIQAEYVKRAGTSASYPDKFEVIRRGMSNESYTENQFHIRLLILFYTLLLEQSESIIKNTLIRSYLRNGEIIPVDISVITEANGVALEPTSLELTLDDVGTPIEELIDVFTELLPDRHKKEFIENAFVIWDKYIETLQSILLKNAGATTVQ